MAVDVLKYVDFKHVRTLITKNSSDLAEWKVCNEIPFKLLDKESTYIAVFIVIREHGNFGYASKGMPEILYKKVEEKIETAGAVLLAIFDDKHTCQQWYISKD